MALTMNRFQIAVWPMFLYIIEGLLIVMVLSLFSYGYPDAARRALWEEGGANGFNSDPRLRIYFYANDKEPPEIPFIWSRRFTDFNLSVAILTLCVFCTGIVLRFMGVMDKWTQMFFHCCILPFWILSLAIQKSSDFSDDNHPSPSPWYLSNSCGIAKPQNRATCRVSQASFAMTIIAFCFYASYIWRVLAYEGFDFMLKQCSVSKVNFHPAGAIPPVYEELENVPRFSDDDEAPLMQAWDEV